MVGLIRGGVGSNFIDTSYLAAAVYFGCSLIYLKGDLLCIGLRAQVLALRLLSLAIVFCLIVFVFGFPVDWIWFFVANQVAFFGERSYANIDFFYIYFIASPMIIFLLAYEAWRFFDKPSFVGVFLVVLPVAALFFSGTRFNILIAVLGVPIVYFWRRFGGVAIVWGVFPFIGFAVILKISGIELVESIFDTGEGSNAEKLRIVGGYVDIFSDPVSIIFGQGFNAHTWSKPFFDMVAEGASKTELTYIELFRVFGLFVGALFFVIVFLMIRSCDERKSLYRWIAPAIVMYILVSTLNPYLFSSNGILLLGFSAAVMGKAISLQISSSLQQHPPSNEPRLLDADRV